MTRSPSPLEKLKRLVRGIALWRFVRRFRCGADWSNISLLPRAELVLSDPSLSLGFLGWWVNIHWPNPRAIPPSACACWMHRDFRGVCFVCGSKEPNKTDQK